MQRSLPKSYDYPDESMSVTGQAVTILGSERDDTILGLTPAGDCLLLEVQSEGTSLSLDGSITGDGVCLFDVYSTSLGRWLTFWNFPKVP